MAVLERMKLAARSESFSPEMRSLLEDAIDADVAPMSCIAGVLPLLDDPSRSPLRDAWLGVSGNGRVSDEIAQSEGYALSQRNRKLIEQGFGCAKSVGLKRQVMVRGIKKVGQQFVLTMTMCAMAPSWPTSPASVARLGSLCQSGERCRFECV